MSLSELRTVISFLRRSGPPAVKIIGGEPTMHPRFEECMRMILDAGMGMTLYSNGIMDAGSAAFLNSIPDERLSVVLNLHPREDYTAREKRALSRACSMLRSKITVSHVLSEAGSSPGFLADYIDDFDLCRLVKIKYAKPAVRKNNAHVHPSDMAALSGQVVSVCRELRSRRVAVSFSCGFARCHFSKNEINRLEEYGAQARFVCEPQMDVAPGLEVSYCLPVAPRIHRPLSGFMSYEDMKQYFSRAIARHKIFSPFGNCYKCSALPRGECGAGCAAYTMGGTKHMSPDSGKDEL